MKRKQGVLFIIIVILFCMIGIILTERIYVQEEVKEEVEEVADPSLFQGPRELIRLEEEPDPLPEEFRNSVEKNKDVYAWIDIPDTNIHYPILQGGPSEDYYLNHTIDREAGYPGSIYTQMISAMDFSDYNTVIYGHNMKNGSMFRHLHKFNEIEFFENHEYVTIYTENEMKVYRVYAAVVYSNRHIMKAFNFDDPAERMAFIQSLDTGDSLNLFRNGMTIDENSKLITLATCIGGRPNNRWLVICEEIQK